MKSTTRSSLQAAHKPAGTLLSFLPLLVVCLTSFSFAETWTPQNSGVTGLLHDIVFTDPRNGWAVGRFGAVIHTTDGGDTWTSQVSNATVSLHSVDFVDSLNGWAVGLVENNEGTFLHTTDGGINWVRTGNGLNTSLFDIKFFDRLNGLAVGGDGLVMRTTNEGETWTTLNVGADLFFWDIECISDSTWYLAGQYNINPGRPPVMYYTTDAGQTWSILAEDGDFGLQSVSFIDPSNGWAVGWFGGIIHTTDGGQTWTPQGGRTDEILFEVVFRDQNVGWAVGGERGCQLWDCDSLQGEPNVVLLTTDGGETWNRQPSLTDELYVKIYFFSPDTAWILGDGGTMLRTTDATNVVANAPGQILLLEPADGAVIVQDSIQFRWEAEFDTDLPMEYNLQLSLDSSFSSILLEDSTLVEPICHLDSFEFGITYYWRVRGLTAGIPGPWSEAWQFVMPNVSSVPCQDIRRLLASCRPNGTLQVGVALSNFNHGGEYVLLAIDGVRYLAQVGSNGRAQVAVQGLPLGIHMLELVNPAGCVDPMSISCGAGRAEGGDGQDQGTPLEWGDNSLDLHESELPSTTELLGSYPNPFNASATISFNLAERLPVDLRIYDILGREVAMLVHEELPEGRYSRTWTPAGHASGLYLYRFAAGKTVQTGKLLQVK